VRRRTLRLGLAAGIGADTVLAGTVSATTPSAAGILSSTLSSTLLPRSVTPYHPVHGVAPPAVTSVGRADYVFARAGRTLHTRVWYLGTPFTGPPAAMLFVQGRLDRTVSLAAATTVFHAVPGPGRCSR
jgi:hypothetical protein